jgi:hypothetical protein
MCGLAELAAESVLDVALDAVTSWWQPPEQEKPAKENGSCADRSQNSA